MVGRLDPHRVAVGGHSIGGSFVFDLSLTDHRVAAAFDLDGALFGPAATHTLTVPALAILADMDAISVGDLAVTGSTADVSRQTLTRLATAKDIVSVAIRNARHYDVTDLPAIAPALPAAVRAVAMQGAGTIGRAGTVTTNTVVRRFLDAALAPEHRPATVAELTTGLPAATAYPVR